MLRRFPPVEKVYRIKDFLIERLNLIVERLDTLFLIQGKLDLLETADRSLMADTATLLQSAISSVEMIQQLKLAQDQLAQRVAEMERAHHVKTSVYGLLNPEVGLMGHLSTWIPVRTALDVGSHVGEVSERLLAAGYRVFAFEPCPESFEALVARLGQRSGFHAFRFALGAADGVMDLHIASDESGVGKYRDIAQYSSLRPHAMPPDLPFARKIPVEIRSLSSLAQAELIPKDIGLLKLDTEGYDLNVIRGLGELRPHAVVMEYWDSDFAFGGDNQESHLPELIAEMRARDYGWHIAIHRRDGSCDVSFSSNLMEPMGQSWGNVFFFADQEVFAQALDWCSAVLPRAYFCL